jgi:hypothetical protein
MAVVVYLDNEKQTGISVEPKCLGEKKGDNHNQEGIRPQHNRKAIHLES